MSKKRHKGWIAFKVFVLVASLIYCFWPIGKHHVSDGHGAIWAFIGILALIAFFLLAVAIAGWCNINLLQKCGLAKLVIAIRRRPKKDLYFDKL